MPLLSGTLSAGRGAAPRLAPRGSCARGVTRQRVDGDRADGRLAARGRALEPRHVRLQRIVLGAYRSPRAVGPVRGPACARTTCSTRSAGRSPCRWCRPPRATPRPATARRLRELAVRGTRYTLALFVPLCVTLMALAEPILDVWLGRALRRRRRRARDPRLLLAALRRRWWSRRASSSARARARQRGAHLRRGRRAEPRAVAGAHAGARARGPGARHGDPVRARVPAAAAYGPAGVGRAARRARAARLAARLLARRPARRARSWWRGSRSTRRRSGRRGRSPSAGVLAYWAGVLRRSCSSRRARSARLLSRRG